MGGWAVIPLNGTIKTGVVGSITLDATVLSETRSLIGKYSDSATTKVTAPATADVPIGLRGPATADFGKQVSYTVTVENKGPGAVPEAKVTGTFPAQLTAAKSEKIELHGDATAERGHHRERHLHPAADPPQGRQGRHPRDRHHPAELHG
ncbi:hypothetical protein GCM10020000_12540 [Streptomyces olivoverticillatus]